jgi:hypothetical protein
VKAAVIAVKAAATAVEMKAVIAVKAAATAVMTE